MKNDTLDEKRINGPVLEAAMFLSIPALNHSGSKIIPPPMPTQAPINPAENPLNIPSFIF